MRGVLSAGRAAEPDGGGRQGPRRSWAADSGNNGGGDDEPAPAAVKTALRVVENGQEYIEIPLGRGKEPSDSQDGTLVASIGSRGRR